MEVVGTIDNVCIRVEGAALYFTTLIGWDAGCKRASRIWVTGGKAAKHSAPSLQENVDTTGTLDGTSGKTG